ncbi:retrovirus-related pol polyprotein from transposon TNT 1-94, partial [Tanacetum coccineum]
SICTFYKLPSPLAGCKVWVRLGTHKGIRACEETLNYPIWEVIQNGNGPVSITTDTQGQIKVLPPGTAEEVLARERERKARTTLLMALLEDHLAKFHKMTDAKEMWDAIKSRFGGNDESKKMQKCITEDCKSEIPKISYLLHGSQVSYMWVPAGVDSLSFDDLYNNLRVFENDVKGSTASSSSTQNVAFVSENTSSTNDVSTAYSVSNTSGQNSQVAWISRMKKFYKKTGRKLQFDAKEPVGFDKTKVECYNCHKTGHFARECRTKGNQDSRRRDAWNSGNKDGRRSGKQEDSKALVTIDGEGVDWTSHSEEEEDYALMACNSSGSDTEVTSCSNECKESYAKLKKLYDAQREQLSDASIEIKAYTQGLKKVEAQLVAHQQGQLWYEEKIRFMKIDLDDKTDVLTYHKKLLAEAQKEKEDLKAKDHRYDGILSYENEVLQSVFKGKESDFENPPLYDRFVTAGGMNDTQPSESETQTSEFDTCESNISTETPELVSEPVVNESNVACQPKVWSDAPIIEEYESDSEDEYVSIPTKEQETPSFANQQVKTPRETVKNHFTHSKNPKVDKKELGYGFTARACFVCGSLNHLIRDCDFHEKRMAKQAELNNRLNRNSSQREIRPIWNNVQRVNNQNQFVPTAVLTRTGKIPVNTARASGTKNVSTARHSFNRQAVLTSAAMKVNTVKPIVNRVRPTTVFHKTHSPFSRPFNKTTTLRTNFSKQKVNTAKVNAVSAVGGKRETAVKPSAGCNWRPQRHNWHNDYPHRALQNKGIVDSGCSRHMTGNKAYLAEYQDFNGGPVAFGGSKGYITGKGKIKTGKLDFEDVCFVKELQHFNLFSVSQMCDKKNKVLFTDSECLVLSPEFKLPDVNTKFDKTHGSQSFLCVTPLNKNASQKQTVVLKTKENHVESKPVTLQTLHNKQTGTHQNTNVISPGMYRVVTQQESQTNKTKNVLSSTGMNATSSVKRPKSRDSHVKTSVLDVSKNEAKKEVVYVRKNKQTDNTFAKVVSNKENVIDVAVANASKAKTLLCVSCMQNVLIPCHDKCVAKHKLNVRSNARRTFSVNSRIPKSSETTFVAPKTRFFEKATQSKTLDTTFVASKSKIYEASALKARDKVSSAFKKKKRNMHDKSLSPFMLNMIRTSRLWQKWFESQPNVMWTPVNTKPHAHTNPSNTKPLVVQIVLWVVDSGCSKHMLGDRSLLRNFVEKFMGTVCFRNENFAAIIGYGGYIHGNITICHVYYVEGLGHNLFSVGQFCNGDLEATFRSITCYVRNLEGYDLLTGGRDSNLYTISISDMAASSPICLMSKATSTKSWLWHRRLSHLNFGTINDLTKLDLVDGLPKFKYEKDHLCSAYEIGKSKKASHPPKLIPSDYSKLELLHMDLCGPMRVASINGKKYILVIVDDFSRFTWVYFLRSKDETPEIIKKFIAQAQLNYKAKVCKIRTDNGTEFKNATLKAYYEKLGIMQQFLIACTPQQNGVVERRNCILVEAACTMLIYLRLREFLSAEAVATACFTQNWLIINTRHNKTPYELLRGRKPNVEYFHVFGSLCYPTNDHDDLGKMKPKADIGVFIGYSETSRGFRIYNRRTKRIMETIHVKFDELTAIASEHDCLEPELQRFNN